MSRYIDADKLWNDRPHPPRGQSQDYDKGFWDCLFRFSELIHKHINTSTADVVEVRHGHWQVCSDEYEICASEFVCSFCKESFCSSEMTDEEFLQMMKFCPDCGAKMDGERRYG